MKKTELSNCREHESSQAVFQCPATVKNVLKLSGGILKNHSAFVWLLMVVIFFLGVTSADKKDCKLCGIKKYERTSIQAYKVNISQEEYKRKITEFFRIVKKNRAIREKSGSFYEGENTGDKKLFTFAYSSYQWASGKPYEFKFDVDIPKAFKKNRKVQDVSLRFKVIPRKCSKKKSGVVTLNFKLPNCPVQKELFHLGLCSPRWIGLSLNEKFELKKKIHVQFRCQECEEEKLKIADAHLNIVLQEMKETRFLRGGKKSNREKRCTRREWKVDLSKIPGFAHVVEPKFPDLGLCVGNCNEIKHFSNQHSHLRYLVALKNETIPKGCCSTSKVISLDVMYADENDPKKLTPQVWNDTVAVECECY